MSGEINNLLYVCTYMYNYFLRIQLNRSFYIGFSWPTGLLTLCLTFLLGSEFVNNCHGSYLKLSPNLFYNLVLPDVNGEGDVYVGLGAAVVLEAVLLPGHT